MWILFLKNSLHFIVFVSVDIDSATVKNEINKFILIWKFRLNFQEREERRARLFIRNIWVATVDNQDFNAFRDLLVVITAWQHVNENVETGLVAGVSIFNVDLLRIVELQESSKVFCAQRVNGSVKWVTTDSVFLKK